MGLFTSFFLLDNQAVNIEANWALNSIVLIVTFAYLSIYSLHSYGFFQQLQLTNKNFQEESRSLRSQIYKLSHYIPPPVMAMVRNQDQNIVTERKRITVFFSDIVGFSELSEELEAETLAALLNHYLSAMSKIAKTFDGTIDKFMGDAIMVLFGDDPETTQGVKKDAIKCVSMALEVSKHMQELQIHWSNLGLKKTLQIRIGINSGSCTVGTFGTDKALDYTALGANVNLASRLE